jgi:ankyrin repeat protein
MTERCAAGDALQAAALGEHADVVRMLLDAHADVNAQGGYYGNALQAAAFGGNTEVVRMLLDAHADVNAQGGRYGSPLHAALGNSRSDTIHFLLTAGADPLLTDARPDSIYIAASSDTMHILTRLPLLTRFPLVTSPVNNRDKLL